MAVRLTKGALCGCGIRLAGAQSVEFVLGIKPRQQVIGLDAGADGDRALGDPAADPEGDGRLVLRLDPTGEARQSLPLLEFDGFGPDRPRLSGLRLFRRLASCQAEGEQGEEGRASQHV
jgi:hypothetical protein